MAKTILQKCYPNHHGWLKLVHDRTNGDWYVREPDSDGSADDVTPFDTLEAAQAFYDERAKVWSETPNWKAQAAYDEKWGTDNGYAPWQLGVER